LDQEKAQTIGLLHDAAKDLPQETIDLLVEEGEIQIHHTCESNYSLYLHGPVGAYYVRRELGIQDTLILEAITGHTYYGNGKHFHDPLSWCVRFADLLEPTRNWQAEKLMLACAERLRGIVFAGDLKAGALLQISTLIEWFDGKGFPVHPRMRAIKDQLRIELGIE
jgi:predicted HD superfamily hydrolase involved in NAD metabolism